MLGDILPNIFLVFFRRPKKSPKIITLFSSNEKNTVAQLLSYLSICIIYSIPALSASNDEEKCTKIAEKQKSQCVETPEEDITYRACRRAEMAYVAGMRTVCASQKDSKTFRDNVAKTSAYIKEQKNLTQKASANTTGG